jgi:hypothetical protein
MRRGAIPLATVCATIALAASPARAQALGDTLGFLRDNIGGQGQLIEDETVIDSSTGKSWSEHWTMQYANLRTDLAACSLTFHAEFTVDGKSTFSGDLTYAFGQVTALRLRTINQNMDDNNARAGHPTWSTVANPPGQDVGIDFAGGNSGGFYIRDPGLAPRIAASIARAAELCGAHPSRQGF